MNAPRETSGRSTLLKALFIVVTGLLVASVAYAAWIVISYWDRVGV